MTMRKILIIDDDIRYLVEAKRCLQTEGCKVSIHEYLSGAPALIRQLDPDIVLLNICMQELSENKLSFLVSSNSEGKAVPIVFYSSLDEEGLCNAATRYGARGYVSKGDPSFLFEKVQCFC